ncbi:MAG: T9SS type A sorting domain-containing protein, partial [Bacteroidales bacterium]|nr:T9SS type A sorting domain-containing protein [Bacteroidales bacterium]
ILWADNDSAQGPLHLNFGLEKNGEAITLAKEEDGEIIFLDIVSFNRQTSDISKGRMPNGGPDWRFFKSPTPGKSNVEEQTDIEDSGDSKATGYALRGNYPNPFKNTTTVNYRIPKQEHVRIAVYNNLGKLEKVLVDRTHSAGSYSVQWNAEGLSPGIYFYEMKCDSYSEVRRALIAR